MRDYGQTFRPEDIGWIDFETQSTVDLENGTYRYMTGARVLLLLIAIGEGPAEAFPDTPWDSLPPHIHAHMARVRAGEAVWAAWNASFDRECWNQLTDYPELDPHHIIDVMAQATAAGLPGKLDGAARYAGAPVQKRKSGKALIKLFTLPDSTATAVSHPDEWAEFVRYGLDDVDAMRCVFRRTLQLPIEDWQEYWVSERINLTGIAFDQTLARRAQAMAAIDKGHSAGELQRLTDGQVDRVTKVKSMIAWLRTALQPADQSYLVRRLEKRDEETDEVVSKARYSLDRRRIQLLAALLDAKESKTPDEIAARRLLDIRQYGGSTTPAKFSRMLETHVDGLLLGQYVFNGASQTGRFSSRICQIHNLLRDALPYELDAIDALRDGCSHNEFATLGSDIAVSRKLSMLIRPTLVPELSDNVFVWGDWSQIEARITPWLAGVESRLDIFRAVDADPSQPDLYVRTAATISAVDVSAVSSEMRQRGKVMELALTFCGGRGALQNMAANYGMHIDDKTAQLWVSQWREANPWAGDFGDQLWNAMRDAHETPETVVSAGMISFIFLPDYLRGTLLCRLPSGRCLTYRGLRWETVHEYDEEGEIIDSKWELTFARGYGRVKLWKGIFVENCLSGDTLVATDRGWVALSDVTLTDLLWDGDDWIEHGGVVAKGVQQVIDLDGVYLTPDHQVLTTTGWRDAESVGSDRAAVRLPDSYPLCSKGPRSGVADSVRLRKRVAITNQIFYRRRFPIVRMHDNSVAIKSAQRQAKAVEYDTRYVEAPSLCSVAINDRSLSVADASGVAQLRGARNYGVRTLADVRSILGGYGPDLPNGFDAGAQKQQWQLRAGQLPLGVVARAGRKYSAIATIQHDGAAAADRYWTDDAAVSVACRPVYDILDAGPRSRFVVLSTSGPMIVHNCTQGVAADVLRSTLVHLHNTLGFPPVRSHTHDEVLVEAPIAQAEATADRLVDIMESGYSWSHGLPLKAESVIAYSYTKCPVAQGL